MMVTLTGFMGSGKTTVGKVLADFLGCPFMDLDDLVVKKAGKSIPDIFAQDGEPAFRELEARLLRQTVAKYAESTAVLALGGGAVLAPASAALLHEKTVCIYLRATLDTLLVRLEGETAGRPLLQEIPDQVGDDGGGQVRDDGGSVVMPGSGSVVMPGPGSVVMSGSGSSVMPGSGSSVMSGSGSSVMPGPDRASVAARLASREPIYEKTAHVIIDTDGLSPDEVADEIIISAL